MNRSTAYLTVVALVLVAGTCLWPTRRVRQGRPAVSASPQMIANGVAERVPKNVLHPAPSESVAEERATSPSSRSVAAIVADDLPPAVRQALDDPSYRPRYGEVPLLNTATERELVARYRATSSMTNKFHLALILTYGGSDESVRALANSLTEEYADQEVAAAENDVLLLLPMALGMTASRSETALRFLVDAANISFWRDHCRWQSPMGPERTAHILTGSTIKGLGVSGRSEAMELFHDIRARGVEQWPRSLRPPVVDAVFVYCMVRQYGEEYLSGRIRPDFQAQMLLFAKWRTTPEAREWIDWSNPENRN